MSEPTNKTARTGSTATLAESGAALLDLHLTPQRSLSPRGFVILMVAVGTVSFSAGLAFFLAGAWPVVGFLGLDVLLIYLAFKVNYRRGRISESLHLTENRLTVQRIHPSGRQEQWEFQPHWLQVLFDLPLRPDSQLVLRSHGRSLAVGAFLTARERLEIASTLRAAIAGLR